MTGKSERIGLSDGVAHVGLWKRACALRFHHWGRTVWGPEESLRPAETSAHARRPRLIERPAESRDRDRHGDEHQSNEPHRIGLQVAQCGAL